MEIPVKYARIFPPRLGSVTWKFLSGMQEYSHLDSGQWHRNSCRVCKNIPIQTRVSDMEIPVKYARIFPPRLGSVTWKFLSGMQEYSHPDSGQWHGNSCQVCKNIPIQTLVSDMEIPVGYARIFPSRLGSVTWKFLLGMQEYSHPDSGQWHWNSCWVCKNIPI